MLTVCNAIIEREVDEEDGATPQSIVGKSIIAKQTFLADIT